MSDVSIVIVSYNTATVTLACITSIQKHLKRHSYEIIVVDNASKDILELKQGLEQSQSLKLICKSINSGFAKGVNTGICESKGEFILLLNSDTLIEDDCLDLLVEKCRNAEDLAVISPRLRSESGETQLSYGPFPSITLELIYLLKLHRILKKWIDKRIPLIFHPNKYLEFNNGYLVAACVVFPRTFLQYLPEIKLYDQMFLYGEEFIWFREFKKIGAKFIYEPSISILHFVGLSSDSGREFYYNRKYNQMLGERTYLRRFHSKLYRLVFFTIRLFRLKLISFFDREMKMRYDVCLKLLKSGI